MGRYLGWSSIGCSDETRSYLKGQKSDMVCLPRLLGGMVK